MSALVETVRELGYWSWFIAGVALLIIEVVAPGAIFMWLGIAALAVGGLSFLVPTMAWELQFALFAVISVISIVLSRRYLKKRPLETANPTLNKRGQQYVGRVVELAEAVHNGTGRVRLDDTFWRVAGTDLPAGAQVEIVGSEGTTLRVIPFIAATAGGPQDGGDVGVGDGNGDGNGGA